MRFIDLTGKSFNQLTVIELLPKIKGSRPLWLCLCTCGATTKVSSSKLVSNNTKSCGCRYKSSGGESDTPMYATWRSMINRCYNKKVPTYQRYGGRGITVCPEWLSSYLAFKKDMGEKPSNKYTLERKNNDLGYNKDNCVWATHHEQHRNMSSNLYIKHNNKTHCLIDWAKETSIPRTTIRQRLEVLKWPVAKALETPPLKRGGKKRC